MSFQTGPKNLITDVAGIRVGNTQDEKLKSGVTALILDRPAVAGVQVLGGAPGTRETDLLEPHNSVQEVHAIVLSGGSAFGLDAASGVQAALREKNIGLDVRGQRVPIVPTAILFDLINGGDKNWGLYPPYRELGYEAARLADYEFELGSVGSGAGALTAVSKGGLGSASTRMKNGAIVGALVAANPLGSTTIGKTKHFWAAPFEIGNEFGGYGLPSPMPDDATDIRLKFIDGAANTTIAVIATDMIMSKAAAKRFAVAAHDGFSRAIWPAHTPHDGDLVFALATGESGIEMDDSAMMELSAIAASTMSRAIARGIHAAKKAENDLFPVWSSLL